MTEDCHACGNTLEAHDEGFRLCDECTEIASEDLELLVDKIEEERRKKEIEEDQGEVEVTVALDKEEWKQIFKALQKNAYLRGVGNEIERQVGEALEEKGVNEA